MKRIVFTAMLFVFAVLVSSCTLGTKWWVKHDYAEIVNTPEASVISMAPGDYKPGPGMYMVHTSPASLPPHFFEDISTISVKVFSTRVDFSFINDFREEWKSAIEEGLATNGNSIIFFNAKPREYVHVAFDSGKEDVLNKIKLISKRTYNDFLAIDPNGSKQLIRVYVHGVRSYKRFAVMVLFDSEQADYLWYDSKKTGRMTFRY